MCVLGGLVTGVACTRSGNEKADLDASIESVDAPLPDACMPRELATAHPPVDVIWAVDSSSSMADAISKLEAAINGFAGSLQASGIDFRIVMIAANGTGSLQVCVPQPLGGPNCTGNSSVLRLSNQIIGSTNALTRILETYDSNDPSLAWSSFVRVDALKGFIVTTDDNTSLTATSFDAQLLAKLPAGMFGSASARHYVFHGILGVTESDVSATCPTAANNGSGYHPLATITGGGLHSICADYGPILESINRNLRDRVACELLVSPAEATDADMLSVRLTQPDTGPIILPRASDAASCAGDGWYLDDNSSPRRLILCPETCTTVLADPNATLAVLTGCNS